MFGSNSGLFRAPDFIVSPVGKEGKKKQGERRKTEGIKKERKEEGVKKKKKDRKKKELKTKSLLLALNLPTQFCWSSWLGQGEEGFISFFSLPKPHSLLLSSLQPSPSVPFLAQPRPLVHHLGCP